MFPVLCPANHSRHYTSQRLPSYAELNNKCGDIRLSFPVFPYSPSHQILPKFLLPRFIHVDASHVLPSIPSKPQPYFPCLLPHTISSSPVVLHFYSTNTKEIKVKLSKYICVCKYISRGVFTYDLCCLNVPQIVPNQAVMESRDHQNKSPEENL